MAINNVFLNQLSSDPSVKWVMVQDEQGNQFSYKLNDDQFGKLAHLGLGVQNTFTGPINFKGQLPGLDFLKQQVLEKGSRAYEQTFANQGLSELRRQFNVDFNRVRSLSNVGLQTPSIPTSQTPAGQTIAAQNRDVFTQPFVAPQIQAAAQPQQPSQPILMTGPSGQQVYVDLNNPDAQGYIAGGFRPVAGGIPQTPTNPYGLTGDFANLFDELKRQLEELKKRGQVINPGIEITPARIAEFTKQAETEINPYYANQLKLARGEFLREVGYTADQLIRQEQDLERKYGRATRQIGEQAAESGFALSGQRQEQERELAGETQRDIEARRRELQFRASGAAGQFAQRFGTSELPTSPQFLPSPAVSPGERGFGQVPQSNRSLNLYELSPNIYQDLVGSEEFERRGAVGQRASGLERAFREEEALKQQRRILL